MKKVKTKSVLTIRGGLIAVTAAQFATRTQVLKPLDDANDGLEDGFMAAEVLGPIQFKSGEELYLSPELMGKKGLPSVDIAGEDTDDADDGDGDPEKAKKKTAKKKTAKKKTAGTDDGDGDPEKAKKNTEE